MKIILCLTDFSEAANHAVSYGYEIAKRIKAKVIICNIINIPAEIPQYEVVMWPLKNFDHIEADNRKALKELKIKLERNIPSSEFHPPINCICETGVVADVVNDLLTKNNIYMIVMGTHAGSGLKHLLFGNHTRYLIDSTKVPLLLVPPKLIDNHINWIGFATDLSIEDILLVCQLIEFASCLDAEIILMHIITSRKPHSEDTIKQQLKNFVLKFKNKCYYDKISFQYTIEKSVTSGLINLCVKNENSGLLAIAHKNNKYINEILKGSLTQKMAKRTLLPLIVIPFKGT